LRRIEESYVKTGKVKVSYKYFPVVDMAARRVPNESYWAAYAAECANEQGKFWEYHDKLFSEWRGEFVGTYTKPNLKKYAADLQLDTAQFNQCLDSERTKSKVEADVAEAGRLGLNSTPTFLVNGKELQLRSFDYSEFARTFDSLLR
jgi:protein-disulfide isomerase